MVKLTAKVTFSFSKLKNQLIENIKSTKESSARDLAEKLKNYIKDGKVKPVLTKTTKKRRKKIGYNSFYPNLKGNQASNTKPLYATGKLVESIKGTSEGISFNHYGKWHDDGIKRPERPWLSKLPRMRNKVSKKSIDKFKKGIKSAFSLKTPKTIKESITK